MQQTGDSSKTKVELPWWRKLPTELAGACGDLGTFIPHVIGAITVAGLAPAGVLIGFGHCYRSSSPIALSADYF